MESADDLTAVRIEEIAGRVDGHIITPNHAEFDDARSVWNGAVEKSPDLIVRPRGPADIVEIVNWSEESGWPIAVKSSGHHPSGNAVCDEGIVLDLSDMDDIEVDPATATVRVQAGATWEQVNRETAPYDLLPPGGRRPVGVAGFTLGGGQGYLLRTHGLASDLLREVEVVTAGGDRLRASESQHEDLFWALRGGGGNFAIVTSFEFDCVPLSHEFMTANLLYPVDDAPAVLRLFRDQFETAPDELLSYASLMPIPEMDEIDATWHGEPGIWLSLWYIGPTDEAGEAFSPFMTFGDPLSSSTRTRSFALEPGESMPAGRRRQWGSAYVEVLSDELIDRLVTSAASFPSPKSFITVYWFGGATGRIDPDATAYPHRHASFLIMPGSAWEEPTEDTANRTWVRDLRDAVTAAGTGGEFLSLQSDTNEDRVRAAFGDHYDRLQRIKRAWDPENRFRINQNIVPSD